MIKKEYQQKLNHIIAVSVFLLVVVVTIKSVTFCKINVTYFVRLPSPFHEEGEISHGEKFAQALANALIIIGAMIVLLALLYKYKCYKIYYWLLLVINVVVLNVLPSYIYMREVLIISNVAMDKVTVAIVIWNFVVVGTLCIYWKGPLLLQQAYHVVSSVMIILVLLKFLPDWVSWAMLIIAFFVSICMETSLICICEKRQQSDEQIDDGFHEDNIPMTSMQKHSEKNPSNTSMPPQARHSLSKERCQCCPKLCLVDFILYGLLVGKLSVICKDWNITIACSFAVLNGLYFTLFLLATYKKALPALSISIAFGLLFNFATMYLVKPFTDVLIVDQIFI